MAAVASSQAAYACSTARLAAVCRASDLAESYFVAHADGSASSSSTARSAASASSTAWARRSSRRWAFFDGAFAAGLAAIGGLAGG